MVLFNLRLMESTECNQSAKQISTGHLSRWRIGCRNVKEVILESWRDWWGNLVIRRTVKRRSAMKNWIEFLCFNQISSINNLSENVCNISNGFGVHKKSRTTPQVRMVHFEPKTHAHIKKYLSSEFAILFHVIPHSPAKNLCSQAGGHFGDAEEESRRHVQPKIGLKDKFLPWLSVVVVNLDFHFVWSSRNDNVCASGAQKRTKWTPTAAGFTNQPKKVAIVRQSGPKLIWSNICETSVKTVGKDGKKVSLFLLKSNATTWIKINYRTRAGRENVNGSWLPGNWAERGNNGSNEEKQAVKKWMAA